MFGRIIVLMYLLKNWKQFLSVIILSTVACSSIALSAGFRVSGKTDDGHTIEFYGDPVGGKVSAKVTKKVDGVDKHVVHELDCQQKGDNGHVCEKTIDGKKADVACQGNANPASDGADPNAFKKGPCEAKYDNKQIGKTQDCKKTGAGLDCSENKSGEKTKPEAA